jgi:chorismate mutase
MFNRVAQNNDGKLLISDIKKNINKTIKRLKNKNNLLAEYLNSCEDQLFNKKITTQYKENIIDEINKDIKDKLSVIRFYCDIINKWKKLKDKQDLNIDINEINDKVIKHIFNQSKKEQYTNIDDIKKYYNVMGNCINLNNVYP